MVSAEETRVPKGVVTPLVTLLTDSQEIDTGAMARLVENQVAAGVDAVFVLGSVGEGPMLSRTARTRVIECVVKSSAGRVPVYAGVSDNSTKLVIEALHDAAGAGAAAGVATLPFYGWSGGQNHARDFFWRVADASLLPLIVYNLPKIAGMSLDLDTVLDLAKHPCITGLKDTRDDFESMRAVAAHPDRQGKLTYLVGNTVLAGKLIDAGADGVVSTLGNLFPSLVVKAFRAFTRRGETDRETFQRILEKAARILDMPTAPAAIKHGLRLKGIGNGATVHPWPGAYPTQQRAIKELMEEIEEDIRAMTMPGG